MISDERLDKALTFLVTTDEEAAKAKARMEGLRNQEKTHLGLSFLAAHGTMAEKEAHSRTSVEYKAWQKAMEDAVLEYEILKNKRNTEAMIVEVWRTLSANMRRGNV